MNCNRCPHMQKIITALKPCQSCEAGELHGQVSADAAQSVDFVYAHRRESAKANTESVTPLDPDTEDALRKMLTVLVGLEPIELLLVQHVMRGGSYASFGQPLAELLRRLRTKERELSGKKPGMRSLTHTWAKRIVSRLPALEKVFSARIAQDAPKLGQKRSE